MADQQFCLRWNHHHTTLINVFESLLKDESLVDVTLYAEGRAVRAHKVVLSACSQYFKAIFSAHQENHPVIILKDVLFSELRALVDYMYIGEVNVSQDQLASLIKTAESLKIKGLADGSNRKPAASPPPALPLPTPRLPPPPPPLPPLPLSLPLPMPPAPFPHVALRATSPHAVARDAAAGGSRAAAPEQPNGRISPPPSKRQRRASEAESAGSGGSPPPGPGPAPAAEPERPPSAHSSPSLPRIPATITPLAASRAESPLELDLSVRPAAVKPEPPADGRPPAAADADDATAAAIAAAAASDDGSDDYDREESDRAGPSGPPAGPASSEAALMNTGYMNWQLGGDGVEVPYVPSTEAGGPQDAFLHRALNVRFQQLLQQQRYDQLLAHAPPPPPGPMGLPLLLRRESPTSPCKQYACEKCGRQYASSGNLKRHVKYECGVEPQFQCPVCKKKFQHRHSVKIHVVSTHKSENPELIKDYLM